METKSQKALLVVDGIIDELVNLVKKTNSSKNYEIGYEQLERWKTRSVHLLNEHVNPIESKKLESKHPHVMSVEAIYNFKQESDIYINYLQALKSDIQKFPEDFMQSNARSKNRSIKTAKSVKKNGNSVFIVHGHDELNLLRLKELLKGRWKLNPFILSSRPGKGRTIIEKFEQEAKKSSFAFVLFTPDDMVEKESRVYVQPRPNVIFELGWFYGRLGRDRVCIVYKEGTNIHSDLDGISRIQFKETVNEKIQEIENELLVAGLIL